MLGPNAVVLHQGRPVAIPNDVVNSYAEGDKLFVSGDGGLLHVPRATDELVAAAVGRAHSAFSAMRLVDDRAIGRFFSSARRFLADEQIQSEVHRINDEDCHRAHQAGRSTTRLRMDDKMVQAMLDSLDMWSRHPIERRQEIETVHHDGWSATQLRTPLGVVGFVFEGRPNVVIDACGVFVTGNTCVFRIGRDARATARALIDSVIVPALRESGLPDDSIVLIESDEHASGWSLFSQPDLGLAVARGSGKAVEDLGSVARQCGVPISLHGRGGAWMLVGESADAEWLSSVVTNSLDRKVCNTANVICVPRTREADLGNAIAHAVIAAARPRQAVGRIHVVGGESLDLSQDGLIIQRADRSILSMEWEWENEPEVTLCIVDSFSDAIDLFNEFSPRFAASVVTQDDEERERAWNTLICPFVGNGMSRWVDGQYAFERPELGLSNWEVGVPLGRGAILSGSDISAIRYLATQVRSDLRR